MGQGCLPPVPHYCQLITSEFDMPCWFWSQVSWEPCRQAVAVGVMPTPWHKLRSSWGSQAISTAEPRSAPLKWYVSPRHWNLHMPWQVCGIYSGFSRIWDFKLESWNPPHSRDLPLQTLHLNQIHTGLPGLVHHFSTPPRSVLLKWLSWRNLNPPGRSLHPRNETGGFFDHQCSQHIPTYTRSCSRTEQSVTSSTSMLNHFEELMHSMSCFFNNWPNSLRWSFCERSDRCFQNFMSVRPEAQVEEATAY